MPEPTIKDGSIHDTVVRYVAKYRFPFPDQTDWPPEYVTITNESERLRGIETGGDITYPDIVIVDSRTDQIVEIGEVEVATGEQFVEKWRLYADRSRQHSGSGARHFFVYAPAGLEAETQALLEQHAIPYGGVRAYTMSAGGQVAIVPITTPVDPKDHR